MKDTDTVGLRSALVLLFVILGGVTLRLVFTPGLSGNDDISLAHSALALLDHGIRIPDNHYFARFGLTLPLAAVFRFTGVGIQQLDLLPFVVSIAGMVLAWRLGSLLFEPIVGIAAAAAFALFPMAIEHATLFFPDAILGALLATAVLSALLACRKGPAFAVIAGALWAWAYYVKVDAVFLAPVLLLATALGYLRLRDLIIIGLVALAFVGVELVAYGLYTGRPFLHMNLEHAAANEVLAPGHDYRILMTYPRTMFIVPYEAGLHYYVMLAAILLAIATRSRPAALIAGWVLVWLAWLMFGADPIGGAFRLKPQLPRYLMSFAIPMTVLVGWFGVQLWRYSRLLGTGMAAAGVTLVLLLSPLNQLSFEPGYATRVALDRAINENWLPLYPDAQSMHIISFLLHGEDAVSNQVHPVQRHNFLTGETHFSSIPGPRAFLLINQDYARIEGERSLVRPIDPASFGLRPTKIAQVDNPLPRIDYIVLQWLSYAAGALPATLRNHIRHTTAEVMRPADVELYRLDTY